MDKRSAGATAPLGPSSESPGNGGIGYRPQGLKSLEQRTAIQAVMFEEFREDDV
jgi:hypothetical protein